MRRAHQDPAVTPPPVALSALSSWTSPSWPGPLPPARVIPWLVSLGAVAAAAVSLVTDLASSTPCTAQSCGVSWTFSLFAGLLAVAVLLPWWHLGLALVGGLLASAVDLAADPAVSGRVAFGVYGVGLVVLAWHRVVTRETRAAALTDLASPTRPAEWVGERARAAGPVPWDWGRLALAGLAALAAVVGLVMLALSWSTYQDRLASAEVTTATVTQVTPENDLTLVWSDPGSGVQRDAQVLGIDDRQVGDRVHVRVDRADPGWVELVDEPWDESYWLSLATAGGLVAVGLGSSAVRRRRALGALLVGEHPGVRVAIAPVRDRPDVLGVSTLDDPGRRVWATLGPGLVLTRQEEADEEVPPAGGPAESTSESAGPGPGTDLGAAPSDRDEVWARPVEATLYGDLRPDGVVGLLTEEELFLDGRGLCPSEGTRERLSESSPGAPLPRDVSSATVTQDLLDDLEDWPVPAGLPGPGTSDTSGTDGLPFGLYRPLWRRVVDTAVPALVAGIWWFVLSSSGTDEEVSLPRLLVLAVGGSLFLLDSVGAHRPRAELTSAGVQIRELVRSEFVPWPLVRSVQADGRTLVVDLHGPDTLIAEGAGTRASVEEFARRSRVVAGRAVDQGLTRSRSAFPRSGVILLSAHLLVAVLALVLRMTG